MGPASPSFSFGLPKSVRKRLVNAFARADFAATLFSTLAFDFPDNKLPDGFTATNAIATAAERSVPAIATRTIEVNRFRLNERGIFMFVELRYQLNFSELSGDFAEREQNRQHF